MIEFQPKSSRDVLALHKLRYDEGVQNGSIVPFTYPMCSIGIAVVVAFLLVHPSSNLDTPLVRWAVMGFMTYWHVWMIVNCRSFNEAPAFGIGIVSATLILWAATKLIFRDAKREFKRIESRTYVRQRGDWWSRTWSPSATSQGAGSERESNGSVSRGSSPQRLRKRSGTDDLKRDAQVQVQALTTAHDTSNEYFWQGYPSGPFIERVDWVLDLYCSFRGTGWSWLISGLPGPPAAIQDQLRTSDKALTDKTYRSTDAVSHVGVPRYDTFESCIKHSLWMFLKGYLAIDAFTTYITRDAYFWGIPDAPAPDFLPLMVQQSWMLTRYLRLLLAMTTIWLSLRTVFCLAPLFYVGLLGAKRIGPRGEPWNYPDHYGSFSNVFRRGLAGWWGGWWHQTFRFMFESATAWTLRMLDIDKRSTAGKAVALYVSFGLSGILHASGSATQLGNSRPLAGPMVFFLLQPLGIALEVAWLRLLHKSGVRPPWPLAYAANFVWVNAWLFATAPFLVHDFARGGLLLYRPFPVSLCQGLGLGAAGTGWWAWGGEWARWHADREGRWWMSGIAL